MGSQLHVQRAWSPELSILNTPGDKLSCDLSGHSGSVHCALCFTEMAADIPTWATVT